MITAKEYFEQNAGNMQQAYEAPIAKIRAVKQGDKIFVNNFGIGVHTVAPEDGWHAQFEDVHAFLDAEKMAAVKAEFNEVAAGELQNIKQPLPEGAKIKAVKQGDLIVTQPWSDTDLGVQSNATQDGYVVTLPSDGKARFYSDLEFRTVFDTDAQPQNTDETYYRYIPKADDKPVAYVVLQNEVTFDFEQGPCTVPAGGVLVENEDDVDGYTAYNNSKDFALKYQSLKPGM